VGRNFDPRTGYANARAVPSISGSLDYQPPPEAGRYDAFVPSDSRPAQPSHFRALRYARCVKSYFLLELDRAFADRLDVSYGDREMLDKILARSKDWPGAIRVTDAFGDDQYEGRLVTCQCRTSRYELGQHGDSCRLLGYQTNVLAFDVRTGA
jgi:hypothetical protein